MVFIINRLVFIILVVLASATACFAFSQDESIESIFHDEQRTFHCERYKKLNQWFEGLPQEKVDNQLNSEIAGLKLLLKSENVSFQERRLFQKQIKILKKILKFSNKKEGAKVFQEKICKTAQTIARHTVRGVGWMANGIMVSATTPVESIGKLTRGIISGEVRDGTGDIYYDFMGPQLMEGVGGNLLFSQRYLELAIAQPWLFPILAAPIIEAEVMKVCKRKHSLRSDEQKYCAQYVAFKQEALKVSKSFEVLGAKIHKLFAGKSKTVDDEKPYTQEEILRDLTKLDDGNFCSEMMKIGEKFKKSKKQIRARANLETWRIGTNPERYGMPDIVSYSTPQDILLKNTKNRILKNVVISVGPAEWLLQGEDKKERAKNYKVKYKNLTKLLKRGRKIFQNADNVEECEELKSKYDFDYENFERLAEEVNNDDLGRRLFESNRIKALFKSEVGLVDFFKTTKLKWEFIESGDSDSIHKILRSPGIGNVILVMHGTEKGKLIDSNNSELPRTFFSNISPSIMSLNFFSCFSQKIESYYGLSKEMLGSKTYHSNRHVSFVEMDAKYSYKQGQVPFESFPGFFNKVDHFLSHSSRGNRLMQSLNPDLVLNDQENQCELQVHNLGQKKATFSLTINNMQIGIVSGESSKFSFEFNCSILKDKDNALRFIKTSLDSNEALSLEKTNIYVITSENVSSLTSKDLKIIRLNENVLGLTGSF